MESVDVMLSGRVLPGTDPNRAGADLARISGLDLNTALAAITSGQPSPVLQGLTPEHGLAWLARMNAIGIEASLQTSTVPAAKSFGPPPETPTQAQAPSQPASRQAGTDSGHWLDKARKVPAGHGKFWIRDSWRLVRERPGVWIAVLLMLEGFICVSCLIDFGGRRFVPHPGLMSSAFGFVACLLSLKATFSTFSPCFWEASRSWPIGNWRARKSALRTWRTAARARGHGVCTLSAVMSFSTRWRFTCWSTGLT